MTTKKKISKEPTKKEMRQALKALGKTKNEVAKTLISERCKGQIGRLDLCPVAIYLQKTLSHPFICVGAWEAWTTSVIRIVGLPEPVREFIFHFDIGNYSKLIK